MARCTQRYVSVGTEPGPAARTSTRPDVLVVGAGPAGAIAATALAQRGVGVLLADAGSPDPGAWDVLLAAPTLQSLSSVNVAVRARHVGTVELRTGGTRRAVPELEVAVCEMDALRTALRDAAVAAGVTPLTGRVTRLRSGNGDEPRVEIIQGGTLVNIAAQHVVIATGATSPGGMPTPTVPEGAGVVCAQRFLGLELDDSIFLILDAPSAARRDERPTCVWAVPGSGATATLGVSKIGGWEAASPPELMRAARLALESVTISARWARPEGSLNVGALNTGLSLRQLEEAPWLYVGDAAGLGDPFTGEGLGHAVQSGLLAAESILANLSDPAKARRDYARSLAGTAIVLPAADESLRNGLPSGGFVTSSGEITW